VRSTSRVGYAWQVHPSTATGAPPPLPCSAPSLIDAAYARSTRIAVAQSTDPLATVMVTGTLIPVRAAPQLVPARPAGEPDEQPAAAAPRASGAIVSIPTTDIAGLTSLIFKATPSATARACACAASLNGQP
jgi:hypothetical protein